MKQFLLSLFALMLMIPLSANADIASWTLTYNKGVVSTGNDGTTGTWTPSTTTNVAKNYGGVAFGAKDNGWKGKLTLSDSNIPANAMIKSVTLNCNGGKGNITFSWDIYVNNVKASKSASMTCTAAPASNTKLNDQNITVEDINLLGNEIVIDFENNTGTHMIYIWSITVEYELDVDPADFVAKPVISCEDNMVSIECATEGAEIHYTINGDAPDASSTLYTAEFAISETVTVKAVAVKDGNLSEVAEKECKSTIYKSFAALFAEGKGAIGTVTGPVTVYVAAVSGSNNYVFVKDATGGNALLYNTTDNDYVNGTTFTSVKGTVSIYGELPQLQPYTVEGQATGEAIEPTEYTVATLPETPGREYVKLVGVYMTSMSNNKCTITQDGATVEGRNQFYTTYTHPTDTDVKYDVTGIWTSYNGTKQFQLLTADESTAAPDPVGEFVSNPAADEEGNINLWAGQTVTFTAPRATLIEYTITPDNADEISGTVEADSFEYTMPEGAELVMVELTAMDDDANMTEAFYWLNAVAKPLEATFDFTTENAYGMTSTNNTSVVEKDVFYINVGGVHLDLTGNKLKHWGNNSYDLRLYKNSDGLVVSVPHGYVINSITFTGSKINLTPGKGTISSKVWTAEEDAEYNYVVFTATDTNNITGIDVSYSESETATFDIPTVTVDKSDALFEEGATPQVDTENSPVLTFSHSDSEAEMFFRYEPTETAEPTQAPARANAHDSSFYTNGERFQGKVYSKYDDANKPGLSTTGTLWFFARKDGLASPVHQVQVSVTTGIEDVTVDSVEADAPIYNVYGQRVDSTYRGIVVKGGVKMMQR